MFWWYFKISTVTFTLLSYWNGRNSSNYKKNVYKGGIDVW